MPAVSAAGEAVAIDAQRLTSAVADILAAAGIAAADAQVVATDLVAADLEGIASHGVMLLPMYVDRILAGSVSRRSAYTKAEVWFASWSSSALSTRPYASPGVRGLTRISPSRSPLPEYSGSS